jgi:hypothetical protein
MVCHNFFEMFDRATNNGFSAFIIGCMLFGFVVVLGVVLVVIVCVVCGNELEEVFVAMDVFTFVVVVVPTYSNIKNLF